MVLAACMVLAVADAVELSFWSAAGRTIHFGLRLDAQFKLRCMQLEGECPTQRANERMLPSMRYPQCTSSPISQSICPQQISSMHPAMFWFKHSMTEL